MESLQNNFFQFQVANNFGFVNANT